MRKNVGKPESLESDEVLVEDCLLGNEKAWSALIEKYTNLIFSIPIRRGFSQDEAADIFQSVCLTMLRELSHLRQPKALPAWLIRLTAHTCSRWKAQQSRFSDAEPDETVRDDANELPDEVALQFERRRILHDALSDLSSDCRRLIDLLFFANPPLRYEEASTALGLAKGSMGATRMRCLEKLRRSLEMKGFR
jgi:RNA polymerase sigma factor (sigma-70 family)